MIIGKNPKPSYLTIRTYVLTPRFFSSILSGENKIKWTKYSTSPIWGLNLIPSFEGVQAFWENLASNSGKDFFKGKKRLGFFPLFLCPPLFFLNKSNSSNLWAALKGREKNTITNSKQSFQFMNLLIHPWNIQVAFFIISKTPYYIR